MQKIGGYIILAFLTAPSLVLASGRDVINIVGHRPFIHLQRW